MWQLPAALLEGWSVWAYSVYNSLGEPAFAEVEKFVVIGQKNV